MLYESGIRTAGKPLAAVDILEADVADAAFAVRRLCWSKCDPLAEVISRAFCLRVVVED